MECRPRRSINMSISFEKNPQNAIPFNARKITTASHKLTKENVQTDRQTDIRYALCMYCNCMCTVYTIPVTALRNFSSAFWYCNFISLKWFGMWFVSFATFYLHCAQSMFMILLRGVVYLPRQIRLYHFIFCGILFSAIFFFSFLKSHSICIIFSVLMQKHVPMFQIKMLTHSEISVSQINHKFLL